VEGRAGEVGVGGDADGLGVDEEFESLFERVW